MALLAGDGGKRRYQTCTNEFCDLPDCRIYREGFRAGFGAGYAAGRADGYGEGQADAGE